MRDGNAVAEYLGITDDISCLPFVKDRKPRKRTDVQRCFWSVPETGDVWADGRTAAEMADMLVLYMAKTRFSPLLGMVLIDMEKTASVAVRIAFMQRISEYATRGISAQVVRS